MTLGPNFLFWRSGSKFLDLPAGANLVIPGLLKSMGWGEGGCYILTLYLRESSRCSCHAHQPPTQGELWKPSGAAGSLGLSAGSLPGESQGVFCCACLTFSGRASPTCKVGATSASWFGRPTKTIEKASPTLTVLLMPLLVIVSGLRFQSG